MVGNENIRWFVRFSLHSFSMILTGFLLAFLFSCCRAAESSDEIPLVIATRGGSSEPKISNLLPEIDAPTLAGRGRSDIEIEEEEAPRGYFYPKPAKPFNLPEFTPLSADEPLVGSAFFAQDDSVEVERLPRSPQRYPGYRPSGHRPSRYPSFPSPPPFVPGFIPPNSIRPLPALYGRPGRY